MEEESCSLDEDEERVMSLPGTVVLCTLRKPPLPFPQKMNIPETNQHFGAISWCAKSNLVACASETCTKDPSSDQQPVFWIPVHIFDPERLTQHAIFSVTAASPADWVQHIEWSPVSCPQVLMVGNYSGRLTLWSQPVEGLPNVARANNCWTCEFEKYGERASQLRWLTSPNPYRFSNLLDHSSTMSLEQRFLAPSSRSSMRWPNLTCFCAIYYSGSIQLYWRKWDLINQTGSSNCSRQWFCTDKTALGAGPSGIFGSDASITNSGSLIVAAVPVATASTVVIWEIHPWGMGLPHRNPSSKPGVTLQSRVSFGPPLWPGISPLAAYLISWQEQLLEVGASSNVKEENNNGGEVPLTQGIASASLEESNGPLLYCSPIANLSAYVFPEASVRTTFGASVASIAFDPTSGGSTLVTLTPQGFRFIPEDPDGGPVFSDWRLDRWESSYQPACIHPLFEGGSGSQHNSASHTRILSWKKVATRTTPVHAGIEPIVRIKHPKPDLFRRTYGYGDMRSLSKFFFARHGGEIGVAMPGGVLHVYTGPSLTPIQSFTVHPELNHPAAVAFSSSGCLLCSTWHCPKVDCTRVRIHYWDPSIMTPSLTWERHLVDRFWWSLVCDLAWWDVIASAHAFNKDGLTTIANIMAVLDQDFHTLPNSWHRQTYSEALDSFKSRILEGNDAADVNALILDMQARILLTMLGNAIEASMIDPSTLVREPWMAPNEVFLGLGGDAMAVDPILVPTIQPYMDSVLDLASHFLTRLKRHVIFYRTLASHAPVTNPVGTNRSIGGNLSNGGGSISLQGGQGSASQLNLGMDNHSTGGTAWNHNLVAKSHYQPAEGAPLNTIPVSGAAGSTSPMLAIITTTFPGTPAMRLVGDRNFLHKLCQLLFFCLIFRKRQQRKFVAESRSSMESTTGVGIKTQMLEGSITTKFEDVSDGARFGSITGGALNPGVNNLEDGTRVTSLTNKLDKSALNPRSARLGSGNGGQGYTVDEVKLLFLVIGDLCKKASLHPHPFPKSQVGIMNPTYRLHYIDGQYNMQLETLDASLGPYMQHLPQPRGADASGLLMKELDLHPPAADWGRRIEVFNEWDTSTYDFFKSNSQLDELNACHDLMWPRKRRYAERDAALGLRTTSGLGIFTAVLGSRRDVITGVWKRSQHGVWHTCNRCGRQTVALSAPSLLKTGSITAISTTATTIREIWWPARWTLSCPMCGGSWERQY